jgi:hypothetical protein
MTSTPLDALTEANIVAERVAINIVVQHHVPAAKSLLLRFEKNGQTIEMDIVDREVTFAGDLAVSAAAGLFFQYLAEHLIQHMDLRAQHAEREKRALA